MDIEKNSLLNRKHIITIKLHIEPFLLLRQQILIFDRNIITLDTFTLSSNMLDGASIILVNCNNLQQASKLINNIRLIDGNIPIVFLIHSYQSKLFRWAASQQQCECVIFPEEKDYLHNYIARMLQYNNAIQTIYFKRSDDSIEGKSINFKYKTKNAIELIYEHFGQKLTTQEAAEKCNMSLATFKKRFKKEHFTSFNDYLTQYRLSIASELLEKTDRSVKDIAYYLGYKDVSYFIKLFKEELDLTPYQFRSDKKLSGRLLTQVSQCFTEK